MFPRKIMFLWLLVVTPVFAITEESALAYERADYVAATILLEPQAEQGDVTAQYFLGYMAYMGFGQPQNKQKAIHWFEKAAASGSSDAEFALGLLGLAENTQLSKSSPIEYIKQAAAKGHKAAQVYLQSR